MQNKSLALHLLFLDAFFAKFFFLIFRIHINKRDERNYVAQERFVVVCLFFRKIMHIFITAAASNMKQVACSKQMVLDNRGWG